MLMRLAAYYKAILDIICLCAYFTVLYAGLYSTLQYTVRTYCIL
jgi:hypothetical protein